MDLLGNLRRTKMCGEFRSSDIGNTVVAMGFVAKYRNLGPIIFVDLRDRSGIVQVSFEESSLSGDLFEKAKKIRNEYVLAVTGVVQSRGEKNINPNMPTGEVEIICTSLKILNVAEDLPIVISDKAKNSETLSYQYRYLDLRRESLQSKLILRSKICHITRNYFEKNGFLEIETPFLGKSTPEGARDYLVPSRVHPGSFYALPQSPQIYKQLLMIAGFDRYYQIARCFRDEDLRANRQPEFSQIDFEMSFSDSEDVMNIAEGLVRNVFKETINYDVPERIIRMPYVEAMERFGSDKPDLRFGMEIQNVTDQVKDSTFAVFNQTIANGGSVRAINAKGLAHAFTRKEIDKLTPFVADFGAKGVAWLKMTEEGVTSPIAKFFDEKIISALVEKLNIEQGDICFFVSDKTSVALTALGALRIRIAKQFNLVEPGYKFLWITEFPLLEYDEEEKRYVAVHHPFTAPMDEDIPLLDTDPLKVRSKAYDLVINGEEAGGGSVRIHTVEMQQKMFGLLGMTPEDIVYRFGFFVDAFKYGAPPHCGMAFGLDRMVMSLTGTDNIKDVIAFPKMQNACCLMTEAPAEVEQKQLDDLFISVTKSE